MRRDAALEEASGSAYAFTRVLPAGDEGLLFEFGSDIDEATNQRVQDFAEALRLARIPGVRSITPGYLSVLVEYDGGLRHQGAMEQVLSAAGAASVQQRMARHHLIPVCYGGAFGPDLEDVAVATGLVPQEVVRLHASQEYRVYCLGFSPGFPLCAPIPAALRLPRRSQPRLRVPEGSVAIAGMQTGIYPLETAGGWHLIGRTPARVFSWNDPSVTMILPGDTISFRPVGEEEYLEIADRAASAETSARVAAGGADG